MSSTSDNRFIQVSAKMATRWLTNRLPNRSISPIHVTALSEMMLRGQWKKIDQGIGFDKNNTLIDGEHRLRAIIQANQKSPGIKVSLLVVRGLELDARKAIDKGRPRNISDELTMLGIKSSRLRVGYVRRIAELIVGRNIKIQTIDAYFDWEEICSKGLNWAVDVMGKDLHLKKAPIAGALAFAYRKDPDAVQIFGDELLTHIGLQEGSPSLIFDRWHRRYINSEMAKTGSTEALSISKRVLRCVLGAIRGEKMKKLYVTDEGLNYFRTAYNSPRIRELVLPWKETINDQRENGKEEKEETTKKKQKKIRNVVFK